MARYHFHVEDGQCFPDKDGVELRDMTAVRKRALRALAEMLDARADDFWEDGSMRLVVQDDAGLTLFTLETVHQAAPASQRTRSPPPT